MSEIPDQKFTVHNLITKRLDYVFNRRPKIDEYSQSFRVECSIVDDKTIRVLFGLFLRSTEDTKEGTPAVALISEVLTRVTLSESIGQPEKLQDVPWVGNVLAVMYPFLREKVNYCLSGNGIPLLLPPLNTIEMVKGNSKNPSFKLKDLRTAKIEEAAKANNS
jgi:hypothetical protein